MFPINKLVISFCAISAFLISICTLPAYAQDAENAAPAWGSNCISPQVCELKSEILQDTYVAARVSIFHIRGYYFLQYTIPISVDLVQGVAIAIDDGQPMATTLSSCSAIGCVGTMPATPSLIRNMKTGQSLKVQFVAPNTKNLLEIGFSLLGFTKAFDQITG